jgi:hypothetical protein
VLVRRTLVQVPIQTLEHRILVGVRRMLEHRPLLAIHTHY